jgi:DNA-binding beta-propeller fold protein YncE
MNRREFVLAAAALPFGLRAHPPSAIALVTADLEAHVVAVDLERGRVAERLSTLPGPRSIQSVGPRTAVVAHTASGRVSLVEAGPLRVRAVLDGFAEPRYTAASADLRHAYVTDSGRGEVVAVDLARARIVGRTRVGGPARHVTVAGETLWVALGAKAELVAVLDLADPTRPRLVDRFRPPFLAHDVGFEPGGRRVWVTSGDRGTTAVLDRSGELRLRLPAGTAPQHVSFAGGRAYVTSGADGTLAVHSLRDGRIERTARVPAGSYNCLLYT